MTSAIGGVMVTTMVKGRERYNVNVRYPDALRENLARPGRVLAQSLSPVGVLSLYERIRRWKSLLNMRVQALNTPTIQSTV